jgi:hypothetical protein
MDRHTLERDLDVIVPLCAHEVAPHTACSRFSSARRCKSGQPEHCGDMGERRLVGR